MNKHTNILSIVLLIIATWSSLYASETTNTTFETDHPYVNNTREEGVLHIENASTISVHITGEVEANYDFITVAGHRFTGVIDEIFTVDGDSANFLFTSDSSITKNGVLVEITDAGNSGNSDDSDDSDDEIRFETNHPYANNTHEGATLHIENASTISVHITGEVEANYDFITVAGHRFTGIVDETFTVDGDSVDLLFTSDSSITKSGVVVEISNINSNCITKEELRTKIRTNQDVTHANVSCITDMSGLFKAANGAGSINKDFNQDISNWDVSNVTNMSEMFYRTESFNQPIGSWDVSNVTNMSKMFYGAKSFNQPISSWDVSSVTDMNRMFYVAEYFNQPIGSWDVSNVIDMQKMFFLAHSFNQPIGNWDVSSVTNMYMMFLGTSSFNQPIGNWDVSKVTNMGHMFSAGVIGSTMHYSHFNQPIGNWDVSNVMNMSFMFSRNRSFNQFIGRWDVSHVIDMEAMFDEAESFDQPIYGWNVYRVISHHFFSKDSALREAYKPHFIH